MPLDPPRAQPRLRHDPRATPPAREAEPAEPARVMRDFLHTLERLAAARPQREARR